MCCLLRDVKQQRAFMKELAQDRLSEALPITTNCVNELYLLWFIVYFMYCLASETILVIIGKVVVIQY